MTMTPQEILKARNWITRTISYEFMEDAYCRVTEYHGTSETNEPRYCLVSKQTMRQIGGMFYETLSIASAYAKKTIEDFNTWMAKFEDGKTGMRFNQATILQSDGVEDGWMLFIGEHGVLMGAEAIYEKYEKGANDGTR